MLCEACIVLEGKYKIFNWKISSVNDCGVEKGRRGIMKTFPAMLINDTIKISLMGWGIASQIVFFSDTQGMTWVCKRLSGTKTGLFSEEKQTKLKTIRTARIAFFSKQVLLSYNCLDPALLRLKKISIWKKRQTFYFVAKAESLFTNKFLLWGLL